jgi:hypothetical protein
MVAGCKIFMRAESIPRDEEVVVPLGRLRRVVGWKRKNQIGKLAGLAIVVGSK